MVTKVERDITEIWQECLQTYGGPYLFGAQRTMADAMYAPVVTRFLTYDVTLPPDCAAYCRTIMAMPEMNGLQVSRAIGADPALHATPRILLGSIGDTEDAQTLRHAGIRRTIAKPVLRADLQACVLDLLAAGPRFGRPGPSNGAVPRFTGHVLVAEDNAVNQLVARSMLKGLGLTCEVRIDGATTLAAWEGGGFDAILMDCQMPVMDGLEAATRIRLLETTRGVHVPVLAMTANAMLEDRERCLAAGMDDFIGKPVRSKDLEQLLERWVVAVH